jgi:hypothetical protein
MACTGRLQTSFTANGLDSRRAVCARFQAPLSRFGGRMDQQKNEDGRPHVNWRKWIDLTQSASIIALALSLLSFYRSYFYINQQLDVTVTEVSYGTNRGELYMTVAFSNGGNRDAAVLRVEPALWTRRSKPEPEWVPVVERVAPDIPIVAPRTPLVVKSGGVEVLSLSTMLNAAEAEKTLMASQGGAFLGIRVATMNSDGNLYLLEHPVARLLIDGQGRIVRADPAIHRTLSGFSDLQAAPPGDSLTPNKQTPFVWADEHY